MGKTIEYVTGSQLSIERIMIDNDISYDALARYMFITEDELIDMMQKNPDNVAGSIDEMLVERKTVNEQYIEIWDAKNREYKYCKKRPIDGVTLYFDIADMIAELTDSELGELTRAIYQYGLAENNNEPYELKTDNRAVKMLFPTMKAKHDAERRSQLLYRQRQADRRSSKEGEDNHG